MAGTASAITYTIFGTTNVGSNSSPQVLAQGQLGTGNSRLYVVPNGTTATITLISLANTTTSAVAGVTLAVNGSAATAAFQVLPGVTVAANAVTTLTGGIGPGIPLGANSSIHGLAGTASAVTYTLFGLTKVGSNQSPQVLAQGQLGTADATLYSVPNNTTAVVTLVMLANTTTSAVTGVSLAVNGSAATAGFQVLPGVSVPANGLAKLTSEAWEILDGSLGVTLNGNLTLGGTLVVGTTVLPGGVAVTVTAYNTVGHPVDPTGVVDSTAGIQAAIDAVKATSRGSIYFPGGAYKITGNGLNFSHISYHGIQILGDGPSVSVLNINGAFGLDFAGSNLITMRDIGVVGQSGAGIGILLGRYADSLINGQSRFENVYITGAFTTAAVYSISSEGNLWLNDYIQNSVASKTFYTSPTNDLSVTYPNGTAAVSTNVNTTFVGGLIQACTESATTAAVTVANDTSVFNMFGTYIGTQGKGFYRAGSGSMDGTINLQGVGIENCIANGVSTHYNPIYFDGVAISRISVTGTSIFQTGGTTLPDIYQADNGTLADSRFSNNVTSKGYSFYNLSRSVVQSNFGVTVRASAGYNTITGSPISIVTDTYNDLKSVSPAARTMTGDTSLNGKFGVNQAAIPTLNAMQIGCTATGSPMVGGTVIGCIGTGALYGTYMGNLGSGDGWIQQTRSDAATYYNLQIQPSGGNALVGGIADTTSGARLQVAGRGVQIGGAAQGTCNAAARGLIQYTAAVSLTKDTAAVCAKDASDVYAWRTIY